ncbi:GA-binding subunit beta-2 [Pelobates cultripes]|uniref:GA-binding subunit beta-2 n=1 Tax=Pelobates cultripes TaxID=61616 RepID=A0AAD1TH60_PELCU|nr:GA-binding subunit beta-2 [Pelobates cultripes]
MALDLGKRLLEAARNGEDEQVRLLMQNGAPFTTDWLGTSPLHMAAQCGHYSTVKVLLQAGISRDARTKVDRTPLHMAASDGHLHIVDLLVKNGANVNAKDMLEMTALHWATEHSHKDVVELLLKNGADVNAFSKFGKTAFDIALDKNNPELLITIQEAMQGDVHLQSMRSNSVTVSSPQLILTSGDLTSLSNFVSTPSVKTTTATINGSDIQFTNSNSVLATFAAIAEASTPLSGSDNTQCHSAEVVSLDSLSSSVQQIVEDQGQRVITIVTDGSIPMGTLQEMYSADHLRHQLFVTIENGQQVIGMREEQFVEETVTEAEQPPAKKCRLQPISDVTAENEANDHDQTRQSLQQQLHEATCRAQEYRQQLMEKEQEVEGYRVKLEDLVRHHVNGNSFTLVEEEGTVIISSEELEGTEITEIETVEHQCDIPLESATV